LGAAVVAALLCSVGFALAMRADDAKIEGKALDTGGAAIADAAVLLKPASGAEKRAITDAKGEFTFGSLVAGSYAVTIDAPGFQRTRYVNISLANSQSRQFDFTLISGAVSETVEIDITRPPAPAPIRRESRPDFGFVADNFPRDFDPFPPIILRQPSVFRLSGRLINQTVAIPLGVRPQPIGWQQLRVTLGTSPVAVVGGLDGVVGIQRGAAACLPPARASFTSAVSSEGRFDFSLPSGVYDLCVFANGAVPRGGRGAASSGGAAWRALAGPFSLVVNRDIDTVLVDISGL
jgi:hypothetical protein